MAAEWYENDLFRTKDLCLNATTTEFAYNNIVSDIFKLKE